MLIAYMYGVKHKRKDIMFKNYLKVALRNLKRYKVYSLINIAGLAIGMACFLLIFLFVQDELSYDRYHNNSKWIYRITAEAYVAEKAIHAASTPAPLGPTLINEFPEVLKAARILNSSSERLVSFGQKKFYESRFFFADPSVFDVFTYPFKKGDPKTALNEPYSVVITEETAEKYFGNEDPVGKVINVNNRADYRITGVLKDIPRNSHFNLDFLASFITLAETNKRLSEDWGNLSYFTYCLLRQDCLPAELEKKLPLIVKKYVGKYFESFKGMLSDKIIEEWKSAFKFHLQPLTKIHLHSRLFYEIEANSDVSYVYIFSIIAFFILVIACINFMNLSTARSSSRAKEVSMRKVVGAQRAQLIRQFLAESFFLTFISLLFAIGIVEVFLPAFNRISGKEMSLSYSGNWMVLVGLVGTTILVAVLSGSYPAFLLSAFLPVDVIKGSLKKGLAASSLRKILVVFQFSVSITLIIGAIIIYNQLAFIRNKNLGFDQEQLVAIRARNPEMIRSYESAKNELMQNPDIISVAASSGLPAKDLGTQNTFRPEGAGENDYIIMYTVSVDYDFLKTLGIKLASGRNFSRDFPGDVNGAFILNEAACQKFGWESPLGKTIEQMGSGKKTVIGVVKNFHYLSLHQKIDPLVIQFDPEDFDYFSVKIRPQNIRRTLAYLENTWRKFDPAHPFEYSFLDEDVDKLYKADKNFGEIFICFTILAISIACLGLFGLTSFTAEKRTREISIRKVFGASVSNIVILLSREFARWVLFANLVAWPFAYYAMKRWLQNFAYRSSIGIWIFILAAASAFAIALLTVSFQAIRAALANPVEALRYE